MATLKLTDRSVDAAKAKSGARLELWDEHTPGLCLRVSAKKRAWLVRYRVNGTQRRFVFGDYPAMGLGDARIAAAVILRDAKAGTADPAGDRGRIKAETRAQPIKTFRDLADTYMAACRAGEWRPKGKPQSARTMLDADELFPFPDFDGCRRFLGGRKRQRAFVGGGGVRKIAGFKGRDHAIGSDGVK